MTMSAKYTSKFVALHRYCRQLQIYENVLSVAKIKREPNKHTN